MPWSEAIAVLQVAVLVAILSRARVGRARGGRARVGLVVQVGLEDTGYIYNSNGEVIHCCM